MKKTGLILMLSAVILALDLNAQEFAEENEYFVFVSAETAEGVINSDLMKLNTDGIVVSRDSEKFVIDFTQDEARRICEKLGRKLPSISEFESEIQYVVPSILKHLVKFDIIHLWSADKRVERADILIVGDVDNNKEFKQVRSLSGLSPNAREGVFIRCL